MPSCRRSGIFSSIPPGSPEAAFLVRPFPTVAALHDAMMAGGPQGAPRAATRIRPRHTPNWAASSAGRPTSPMRPRRSRAASGSTVCPSEEFERFTRLNAAYRQRFGLPFVICVRRHTRDSILRNFERRAANDPDLEFANALDEIGLITRLRLVASGRRPRQAADRRLAVHPCARHRGRQARPPA